MTLATLALMGSLASLATAEKVNFAHDFKPDTPLEYQVNFKGSGGMEVEGKANFVLTYGAKTDKGVPVKVKTKSLEMLANGQSMGDTMSDAESTHTLDGNGMPGEIVMNNDQALIALTFILSYLPNSELDKGQAFDVKYKSGDTTLNGTGVFDGYEDVNGKSLPVLKYKVALAPNGENPGDLEYKVYFNPETGHVAKATGKADVEGNVFEFSLLQK